MVVVFGSINLDLVTRVERFPSPGETLSGIDFATHAGGKGERWPLVNTAAQTIENPSPGTPPLGRIRVGCIRLWRA